MLLTFKLGEDDYWGKWYPGLNSIVQIYKEVINGAKN